jgi:hypothetical protein
MLERLARDKYTSLFQKSVNYGCKKFCRIGPNELIYVENDDVIKYEEM